MPENYMSEQDIKEFWKWFHSRPLEIQAMIKAYPPARHIVKQGAPYGVTCEGSFVTPYAYMPNGHIQVILEAKDKLPRALEHEYQLGKKFGKSEKKIREMQTRDVVTPVHPMWIEQVEPFFVEEFGNNGFGQSYGKEFREEYDGRPFISPIELPDCSAIPASEITTTLSSDNKPNDKK